MFTLTAWKPDTRHGADQALKKVDKPHNEVLLHLPAAALFSREGDVGIDDDFIREVRDDARA